jgi:hypothetical protein
MESERKNGLGRRGTSTSVLRIDRSGLTNFFFLVAPQQWNRPSPQRRSLSLVAAALELPFSSIQPVSSIWRCRQCGSFQRWRNIHDGRLNKWLNGERRSLDGAEWQWKSPLPTHPNSIRRAGATSRPCELASWERFHYLWGGYQNGGLR